MGMRKSIFAAAGVLGMGEMERPAQGHEPEPVSVEVSAQREEELIKRVDKRYADAADRLQQQYDDKYIKAKNNNWPLPRDKDSVVKALREYSSEDLLRITAEHSGLSLQEVVHLIADRALHAPLEMDDVARQATFWSGNNAAGLAPDGSIYLNLTSGSASSVGPYYSLQRTLEYTTLLSFPESSKENALSEAQLLTGFRELCTDLAARELHPHEEIQQAPDVDHAHQTAAASLIYEMLPPDKRSAVWKSVLHGSLDELEAVFDVKYGPGAFASILDNSDLLIDRNSSGQDRLAELREIYAKTGPLLNVLHVAREAGEDMAALVVKAENHLYPDSKIDVIQDLSMGMEGFAFLSGQSRMDFQGSGGRLGIFGVIRLSAEQPDQKTALCFMDDASGLPSREGFFPIPGTNSAHKGIGWSLHSQDMIRNELPQIQLVVDRMVEEIKPELIKLRDSQAQE